MILPLRQELRIGQRMRMFENGDVGQQPFYPGIESLIILKRSWVILCPRANSLRTLTRTVSALIKPSSNRW
ncbi:hypothetical protein ETA_22380 [Erwinia tasmaniensis Et1/99]|uniref:Uncharacterized protein n=1 Tax=Erwinia tasmaniensis (strain DSM 17950 / CFBP 7177 / CIP 109463 / NCPPB 4357 / Et1/99) TaxID=465817 RepID=B2VBY6_ERWT9|nr:hypothetical protein ETA_22380 [Erwinia tasmaniensis Et1/99]